MPANPINKPNMVFLFNWLLAAKSPMITSQSGKMAPMIDPRPAEINFTPQVESPLLNVKLRNPSTIMVLHSLAFGNGTRFHKKNSI